MELEGNRIHSDPHNWAESGDEDATEIGASEIYETGHAETETLYTLSWTQDILLRKVEILGNNPIVERSHNCENCEKILNTTACFKNHIEITYTDGALK